MTEAQATPLAPRYRSLLALHGASAVLAGLLGGVGFVFNILRFIEVFPFVPRIEKRVPGTEAAWRAAHTGPIMNGMLAMGVGVPRWPAPPRELRRGGSTFGRGTTPTDSSATMKRWGSAQSRCRGWTRCSPPR
jgi:hypothetical protein